MKERMRRHWWIWIFLVSFRELSLSIMLSGPTTPVVAVAIFELWGNGQVTEVGVVVQFGDTLKWSRTTGLVS